MALGNGRPLASIRVQILVKTTVNDKRQKARIPETKLQWLPARHAILTSGSGHTLNGRESLRAGRDAQLLPCRPAVRYPGPNAHTGPDGRTSVNQPLLDMNIGKRTTGPQWDGVALVKTVLCQKGGTLPLNTLESSCNDSAAPAVRCSSSPKMQDASSTRRVSFTTCSR